ncbi:hypothetical protein DI005_03270 [Prauserella sp. PE36]|uniref:Secreted protein n=1 Tax=Prauserella endophytica TaxID=1592324 RepID=A0ABY2RX96_9PSEU|nr:MULTISPECIES: hypothetical protein [Prauserella]PXY19847.1 hypothetical protein BAY59_32815 [Prauserella coralliicola]RBM23208.1 hypothetical protein DI005_03270 [Prauserella sp. PE36]TKG64304.1 hypothetical protein FCN18_29300 [Prauserella endophytica]
MRTRALLVTAAAVVLLPLSACAREAGPTPKGAAPDPGPGALRVKLEALTMDVCFTDPTEMDPPGCQKYVTQLGTVPGTAQKFAGTEHPELAEAGRALDKAIRGYRDNTCGTQGSADACTEALVDMSTALGQVKAHVSKLPEVTTQSG